MTKCENCELYYATTENHIDEKFITPGVDFGATSSMDSRIGPEMCQHGSCFVAESYQNERGWFVCKGIRRVAGQAQYNWNYDCSFYQEKISLWKRLWLRVKKTPRGYQYSERKGRDSVAVLLYRWVPTPGINSVVEVLIRMQPLPVRDNQVNDDIEDIGLFACPITGSIEEGEDVKLCAVREVEEEAGFVVSPNNMYHVINYFVGTQTNEEVYCFISDVTGLATSRPLLPDGYFESKSHNVWRNLPGLTDRTSVNYAGLHILVTELRKILEASIG